jgi:hypothetical protein
MRKYVWKHVLINSSKSLKKLKPELIGLSSNCLLREINPKAVYFQAV